MSPFHIDESASDLSEEAEKVRGKMIACCQDKFEISDYRKKCIPI